MKIEKKHGMNGKGEQMIEDNNINKIKVQHYRVPNAISIPCDKKGRPKFNSDMGRYNRQTKWITNKEHFDEPFQLGLKYAIELGFLDGKPTPRGGATICIITTKNGRSHFGIARCSFSDNFCYRIGREIAFGRAYKAMQMAK